MNKLFKYCITEIIILILMFVIVACSEVSDTKKDGITASLSDQSPYSEEKKAPEATAENAPDSTKTSGNKGETEVTDPPSTDNEIFPYPSEMDIAEIFADVQKKSWVVYYESEIVCGIELWNEFYDKTSRGESSCVFEAKYYVNRLEGGPPVIYLTKLSYDGITYKCIEKAYGEERYREFEYKYLVKYDKYNEYHYILVNDNIYTYEELYDSLFYSDPSKNIDFKIITSLPH